MNVKTLTLMDPALAGTCSDNISYRSEPTTGPEGTTVDFIQLTSIVIFVVGALLALLYLFVGLYQLTAEDHYQPRQSPEVRDNPPTSTY